MDVVKYLIPGQTLLFELDDGCYSGILYEIKKGKRIQCKKVRSLEKFNQVQKQEFFNVSEIRSLRIFKPDESTEQKKSSIEKSETNPFVTKISFLELFIMEKKARKAIFIDKVDSSLYEQAIQDMRSVCELAINVEGCYDLGPYVKTSILTIATINGIYIFDIAALEGIPLDLKSLLEADEPRKISLRSPCLVSNLKVWYDTTVSITFDGLYVHRAIGGDKKLLRLTDFVGHFYNIPEKFFVDDSKMGIDWNARPFTVQQRIVTARRAMFIYKLYAKLFDIKLLEEFFAKKSKYLVK